MHRLQELVAIFACMIPFIGCYFVGVAVRLGRENRQAPESARIGFGIRIIGEAFPGMLESVITLATVFGVVFQQASSEGPLFPLIGAVASAAFLAFRGGYTYLESLLTLPKTNPPPEERSGARGACPADRLRQPLNISVDRALSGRC